MFESVVTQTIDDWKPGCTVWQNRKTKTLHLQAEGSKGNTFICGRNRSEDCVDFSGRRVYSDSWKCKPCNIGRPVRDVDAMVTLFDRLKTKRVK